MARSTLRLRTLALVLSLLASAPAFAADAPLAPTDDALRAKADGALLDALDAGAPLARVIVLGMPHAPLPTGLPRAQAVALLDASAAPFFAGIRAALDAAPAQVTGAWSVAPAVALTAPPATLALLAARPEVRAIALDRDDAVRLLDAEGADGPDAQNTGGRQMMQADDAWALGFRGEGARIAILGTGIDATHEAFRHANGSTRVVEWVDLVAGAGTPYDDQGHGTYVAGTAAGSDVYIDPVHGAFQEAGVAPAAAILAAKFLDASGSGSFANAIAALDWSFQRGADVTVNGWGSACTSSALAVMQAVRTTTQGGMVNVFTVGAGGPGGSTIAAPACGEAAISVGGIASDGTAYSPSGRGPCSDIELSRPPRICPDLVAKAASVRSAAPRGACALCEPSGYKTLSTLSAPPAFVGGGVALIEQMKRHFTGVGWQTPGDEEAILKATALDLGPVGPDDTFGWGLPQLLAVHAALRDAEGASLVGTLQAPAPVLREGDAATLAFTARNLGRAIANGTLTLTLARPDGSVALLDTREVSLGYLASARVEGEFLVQGETPAGVHTLRGALAYAWTNATTGETVVGELAQEASFEVRRVRIETQVDGLAPVAAPGELQRVRVTVRNLGNEAASQASVRFTAPDHYAFAHIDGLDPADAATSRYAAPTPDEVVEDRSFGRVTLVFDVGALEPGNAWSFDTTLAPTRLGAHRMLLAVASCDGAARCGTQGGAFAQTVAIPSP